MLAHGFFFDHISGRDIFLGLNLSGFLLSSWPSLKHVKYYACQERQKKPGSEDKRCLLKFSSRHCRQTNVGEFSRGQDLGLTGMLAANYLENKNLAMKSVYFLLCRFHISSCFIVNILYRITVRTRWLVSLL